MQHIKDLTGQTFNYLTAIKYVGSDDTKHALWLFKCICGNQKIIRGTNVTTGNIKSCGCKTRGMNFKQTEKHIQDIKLNHGNRLRSRTTPYKNNQTGVTGVFKRSDGRYHCSISYNGVKKATTKSTLLEAIEWRKNMQFLLAKKDII